MHQAPLIFLGDVQGFNCQTILNLGEIESEKPVAGQAGKAARSRWYRLLVATVPVLD